MDTQKVASRYRLSQWAQVIEEQRESGKNIKDFCQAAGINRNAYFYWQRKLRKEACTELAKTEEHSNIVPSGWMQLGAKQYHHPKEDLSIEINGCHVTVNTETVPEILKKVCHILRSL